jgi:hypothetical protein
MLALRSRFFSYGCLSLVSFVIQLLIVGLKKISHV